MEKTLMGLRSSIILLCTIVGLSFLAIHVSGLSGPLDEPVAPSFRSWSEMDIRSIFMVKLEKEKANYIFEKDHGGYWGMISPHNIMARQTVIHVILNSLLQPKIDREIVCNDHYREVMKKEGVVITLETQKQKVTATFFTQPSHPKHDLIYYHDTPSVVYAVVRGEVSPNFSMKDQSYWTRRLFPFITENLKSCSYVSNGNRVQFDYEETAGRNRRMHCTTGYHKKTWDDIFQNWEGAACTGFSDQRPNVSCTTYYTFTFMDGHKARLELFRKSDTDFEAFYHGRKYGQLLDVNTVTSFFPEILSYPSKGTP